MTFFNGYPYYQPLTFDQQQQPMQPTQQQQPEPTQQTQLNDLQEPAKTLFKTVDITLRLESRPCVFKIKDETGIARDVLHYVLVWIKNDNEIVELGSTTDPIGMVNIELKHSTQLHVFSQKPASTEPPEQPEQPAEDH